MDLLENYLKQEQLRPDYDYFDLEEAALRNVIKLSSQSVEPIVSLIESEYRTAKETAEALYESIKKELDNNYNSRVYQLSQTAHEQIEKIQKGYNVQKNILIKQTKGEKEKSADDTEIELAHFKENYEYEIMTADVVHWGSLKKYQNKMAEIKESVSAAKKELNELRKNAEQILSDYNVTIDKPTSVKSTEAQAKQDLMESFQQQKKNAELYLRKLSRLLLPKLFLGVNRYIIAAVICIIFSIVIWQISRNMAWKPLEFMLILSGGLIISIVLLILSGKFLLKKGQSQIKRNFQIFIHSLETAETIIDKHLQNSIEEIERNISQAREIYQNERNAADEKIEKIKAALDLKNRLLIKNKSEQFGRTFREMEEPFNKQLSQIEQQKEDGQKAYKAEYDEKLSEIQKNLTQSTEQIENEHNSNRQRLKECWLERLNIIKTLLAETKKLDQSLSYDWQNPAWTQWKPGNTYNRMIRFGKIQADLKPVAARVKELMDSELKGIETVALPAVLAFPNHFSLFIQTPHKMRDSAVNIVKTAMARLFTSVPPGQIHFTIFDPVGLGKNFVGFMHAADYQKSLVGGRIWTDSEHIQQCLTELTTHMENIIQKYLRNDYKTIEAYNQQAGEFAEPYRFLVIADFPANFNDESIRRLKSIINSGPRCGVYTFIVCDEGQKLPPDISVQDLALNGVHIVYQKNGFVCQNEIFKKFPLELDSPPSEELLTALVRKVGIASVALSKVEVPFETITPTENSYWSQESTFEIKVPIGLAGAKRQQYMQLGRGVNQHMLIAGKTGSGKSTLFHIIISNLAMWYSPDEIEFYLIDFKHGVEFKTYAIHKLPHARAVAIESDREFGLSILQRLDAEMTIRGEKFRQARTQDISSYRKTTSEKMPRTILIIDEFHILFAEDDRIAHEATMLLEKLVRQGRAFGIHIILGSQSLAGTSGVSRSIMGQMAVRIALQCSEMDAQIILNEDNVAARLLSRPGEAIYNDAGGLVVGNNPFQVAWLAKATQDEYLSNISKISKQLTLSYEPMIVFEGNVPADISNNLLLANLIQNPFSNDNPAKQPPLAWLGEPVIIKAPTAVILPRQNGANILIVGQQDFAMCGVLSSVLLSLLAQLSPKASKFTIMDASSADSSIPGKLKKIDSFFPHKCRFAQLNQIPDIVSELALEVHKRLEDSSYDSSGTQFLFISGVQRLRMLYRKEDDWSIHQDEKNISSDKQLAEILRAGPSVGIHTIIGVDTFNTIERIIDRQTLREFNNRVLFQMSTADSSNLVDNPIANQLGFQRALFYNEEQGILEKFRFYAPPDDAWLKKNFHA